MSTRPFAVLAIAVWASTSVGALDLISVEQEIQLGREAQAEVKRSTPEVTDGTVARYVADLGRRLAARADGPKYPYSFDIANYREVNAFALPGGPIWVYRGTLKAAENEAQLASVLAHEIAHVANRHSADQISKGLAANLGLGVLAALLGEGTGAKVAQIGASVAANATMAKFSRDDEREADEKGLVYLKRAGYDPRAAAAFMRILRTTSGRDPGAVEVFFASHPAPAERVTRLEAEAARVGRGGRTTSAAFTAMHARLERLAPAKAMPRQPR